MREMIRLAAENQVAIGVHPGLPDRVSFGRRVMPLTADEIYLLMVEQLAIITGFVHITGTQLAHVKPHGALYHMANVDEEIAHAMAEAVRDFNKSLLIFTPYGSALYRIAKQKGLRTVSEAFADRTYETNGELRARHHADATITDIRRACQQVLSIINQRKVQAYDSTWIPLEAETICIHGDHTHALELLRALNKTFSEQGLLVRPPRVLP
jgi:UPF0271 protein